MAWVHWMFRRYDETTIYVIALVIGALAGIAGKNSAWFLFCCGSLLCALGLLALNKDHRHRWELCARFVVTLFVPGVAMIALSLQRLPPIAQMLSMLRR